MILSVQQGYLCMLHFLDKIYANTQMDDLGSALGSMDINLNDGNPMDSAMIEDWNIAIRKVVSDPIRLKQEEIYLVMIEFIKAFANRTKSVELNNLAKELLNRNPDNLYKIKIDEDWRDSVNSVVR